MAKKNSIDEAKKTYNKMKKSQEAEARKEKAEAAVEDEGAFMSCEDAFYDGQFSNHDIDYDEDFSCEPEVRTKVRSLTFPGDEAFMESIMNNKNCTITNKVITPMPKEGIIMAYIEYEELIEK